MSLFFSALGLMFIMEGVLYFAFPHRMREMAAKIPEMPDGVLRGIGFFAMAAGLLVIFLARR